MKIEDQVCSLEYAKKLKELGIKQESLFGWYEAEQITNFDFNEGKKAETISGICIMGNDDTTKQIYKGFIAAAFTVMELGLRLPQSITQDEKYYRLNIFKDKICWFIAYVTNQSEPPFIIHMNMKEVNCRASMLIHLLENNLITLP